MVEYIWSYNFCKVFIEQVRSRNLHHPCSTTKSANLADKESLNKPNLESNLENFTSICCITYYKPWCLTVTNSLSPFLSELVQSVKRWPELPAKKDYLSLSPTSTLTQKSPSYVCTHPLPKAHGEDLIPNFLLTTPASGI